MQESDLLEYKRPENEEGKAVFEYTEREGEVGKTGGREKRGNRRSLIKPPEGSVNLKI